MEMCSLLFWKQKVEVKILDQGSRKASLYGLQLPTTSLLLPSPGRDRGEQMHGSKFACSRLFFFTPTLL